MRNATRAGDCATPHALVGLWGGHRVVASAVTVKRGGHPRRGIRDPDRMPQVGGTAQRLHLCGPSERAERRSQVVPIGNLRLRHGSCRNCKAAKEPGRFFELVANSNRNFSSSQKRSKPRSSLVHKNASAQPGVDKHHTASCAIAVTEKLFAEANLLLLAHGLHAGNCVVLKCVHDGGGTT